jgi:hypothetical protein
VFAESLELTRDKGRRRKQARRKLHDGGAQARHLRERIAHAGKIARAAATKGETREGALDIGAG